MRLDTNRELPVLPGVGYMFRFGKRSLGVVGIPFAGVAGQFAQKYTYRFAFWPMQNIDARLSYKYSKKLSPYVGFRWQSKYFSRAGRSDNDDQILFEDARLFAGTWSRPSKRVQYLLL